MGRRQVGGIHRFPCQTRPKRCGEKLTQKEIGHTEKYIGGWRKRSSRPKEKIISCRWKRPIQGKAHQLLDPKNTVGRSSRTALVREGIQKTYEVRAVVFQLLESTRSGTPRDPWMKGEPTPAWDYGTRGSSPFWLGEGRVPRGNVATPEAFVFGVGEPGFLQAGRGSAVWETCTEYHCTPTKVFLKFSQSLRRPPTVATWLKAQGPIN